MPMRNQSPAMPFTKVGLRRGLVAGLPFILSNGVAGIVMGVAYRGLGLDFAGIVVTMLGFRGEHVPLPFGKTRKQVDQIDRAFGRCLGAAGRGGGRQPRGHALA